MGLGPGSDPEQFPVGYTARNRAKIMCFQWISNQNQWFSIDFLVRTLLQEYPAADTVTAEQVAPPAYLCRTLSLD